MSGIAAADLPRITRLRQLQDLELWADVEDADLAALRELHKLRRLSLFGIEAIDGTGLRALEALPMLSELDLSETGVDAEGLRAVAALPGIRALRMEFCERLDDAAMEVVATMRGLRRLDVSFNPGISRRGFTALAALTGLRELNLANNDGGRRMSVLPLPGDGDGIGVDDGVLRALPAMKDLRVLSIGRCFSLTPGGMIALSAFGQLEELDLTALGSGELVRAALRSAPATVRVLGLSGTGVDDAMLEWIASRFEGLQELDLSYDMAVTEVGIRSLAGLSGLRALSLQSPANAAAFAGALAELRALEVLDLDQVQNLSRAHLEGIAGLPRLAELHIAAVEDLDDAAFAELAAARSLERLHVGGPNELTLDGLRALARVPLELLDLTEPIRVDPERVPEPRRLDPDDVRRIAAASWPGCRVVFPDDTIFDVPR